MFWGLIHHDLKINMIYLLKVFFPFSNNNTDHNHLRYLKHDVCANYQNLVNLISEEPFDFNFEEVLDGGNSITIYPV